MATAAAGSAASISGHLLGVAQHGGGRQAVAGHVRYGVEDRGGLAQASLDRRCTNASASCPGLMAWASTAALRRGQLANPSSRAMTSWAAARVTAPWVQSRVADEAFDSTGLLAGGRRRATPWPGVAAGRGRAAREAKWTLASPSTPAVRCSGRGRGHSQSVDRLGGGLCPSRGPGGALQRHPHRSGFPPVKPASPSSMR